MSTSFGFKKRRDTIKVIIPDNYFDILEVPWVKDYFLVLAFGLVPIKNRKRRQRFFLASSRVVRTSTLEPDTKKLKKFEIEQGKISAQRSLNRVLEQGFFDTKSGKRMFIDLTRWREIDFYYDNKRAISKLKKRLREDAKRKAKSNNH